MCNLGFDINLLLSWMCQLRTSKAEINQTYRKQKGFRGSSGEEIQLLLENRSFLRKKRNSCQCFLLSSFKFHLKKKPKGTQVPTSV